MNGQGHQQRTLKSTTGEKHLDGSKAGVQSYVNDVTSSDWFVERFGRGGVIGTPKVSLGAISVAGKYEIGTKGGVGYSLCLWTKAIHKPSQLFCMSWLITQQP
jgi:hypothetical protein